MFGSPTSASKNMQYAGLTPFRETLFSNVPGVTRRKRLSKKVLGTI
jgi:hypothetical protein